MRTAGRFPDPRRRRRRRGSPDRSRSCRPAPPSRGTSFRRVSRRGARPCRAQTGGRKDGPARCLARNHCATLCSRSSQDEQLAASPGGGRRSRLSAAAGRYGVAVPTARLRRSAAVALLTVVGGLALAPGAGGNGQRRPRPPALTVMTRNVYVGADVARPVLLSRTRADFERNNTHLWRTVRKTDFPARARLLAREIARTHPDVIGLQEVALWRRGPTGVTDGPATPARRVVYDFLKILRRRLRRDGLRYRVAARLSNSDVEAPTTLGYDVRVTGRDVILVRRSRRLRIGRSRARHFEAGISVAVAGIPIRIVRGWTSVDLRVAGRRLRFVNTHLDPTLEVVRDAQARELLGAAGPTRTHRPLILVGDVNTTPSGGTPPNAYRILRRAGLLDTWVQRNGRRPGRSCCMRREDIMDPPPAPFNRRIDYILTRPRFRVLRTQIVGRDPDNRTRSGLWPSDHGGHVARLRFRRR